MSEDQLRKIFVEGKPDWLEEHSKACLPADEVIRQLDTQTFFELLKLPYPTDRNGVIDRLTSQGLIDQTGDTYAIRRLGGLLLAKKIADFPDLGAQSSASCGVCGKVET